MNINISNKYQLFQSRLDLRKHIKHHSYRRQRALPAVHARQDGEGQESPEEPEAAQSDSAEVPADVWRGRGLRARPQGRRQGQSEVRGGRVGGCDIYWWGKRDIRRICSVDLVCFFFCLCTGDNMLFCLEICTS